MYFSELSPRPHDTGMVTLAGTQNFSEFELHSRAILGIPVLDIPLVRNGASAVGLQIMKVATGQLLQDWKKLLTIKKRTLKYLVNPIHESTEEWR